MDCSMPGFPVLHCLMQFAQTHVHWVDDAIQPSHPLLPPSSPERCWASVSFPVNQLFTSGDQSIGVSPSPSIFPVNLQGLFPLWLTGLISLLSKGLSRVYSSITVQKHHSSVLSLLYGPALTSIHDYMSSGWHGAVGGHVPVSQGLTKRAPLEKDIANHFRIIASRTLWTQWKVAPWPWANYLVSDSLSFLICIMGI